MATWTDDDLLALDAKYAVEGMAFHARPLRAAMDILGANFLLGPDPDPEASSIAEAYARLFPEVNRTWPGMGTGLAASVDRIRKVRVPVVYGSMRFAPYEALGFSDARQWEGWCRNDRAVAAKSCFAAADIFDLTYGFDDLRGRSRVADDHWTLALSNLETVANTLGENFSAPAVTQAVCMTAELSLKAALLYLGEEARTLAGRKYGHKVDRLAEFLAEKVPHRDDPLVGKIVRRLPDYVGSRYSVTDLGRLELVELGLGVQFVAASSVRRLTDRDIALRMEDADWPGARQKYFDS